MKEIRIGGGNVDSPKKLYKSPELHVINIDSCDIICTSPERSPEMGGNGDGNIPDNGNYYD